MSIAEAFKKVHSCPSSVRTSKCDLLSQCKAIGLRVQRCSSSVLLGDRLEASELGSGISSIVVLVQHDGHRTDQLSAALARSTVLSPCEEHSPATSCAWQGWRLNVTSEALVPSFQNIGNRCYYISTMVALIRCLSIITDSPDESQWGFLASIWNASKNQAIAPLEAIRPFL